MTEEQKEKYANFLDKISEILGLNKPVDILRLCAVTDEYLRPIEKHIAELEAGRPKWHKVADGDLPKRDVRFSTAVSIPVLTQDYKFACYYFSSLKWYSQGEEVRVIAWYEIPQYTDKE